MAESESEPEADTGTGAGAVAEFDCGLPLAVYRWLFAAADPVADPRPTHTRNWCIVSAGRAGDITIMVRRSADPP